MTQARLGLSIIICGLCCWCIDFASAAEDPELDALLAQLRDSRVTYHASLKLLSRAKSDRKARAYIAERLPRLLESYGGGKDQRENGAWGSAAEVAGDLRVVAAVPILSRRIDLDTDGPGGLGCGYNFCNHEAVQALILIGQPAVAAVTGVLDHGNPLQREEAAYVLGHIGTEAAWQALKARLPGEADPKVRKRIEELLKHRPKKMP